ncbi:hypothetical protein VFPBJ_04375 [Purpureocillium lilacinum]|uniref:Uncharacterized protein n=1 Tax=Purpureocillium lilacinum TaxID=33203 RepID=A0A179GX26_PURLI|nr:hypothetical protein VFPBJ_04375 [Purpureocillium lilacinum]
MAQLGLYPSYESSIEHGGSRTRDGQIRLGCGVDRVDEPCWQVQYSMCDRVFSFQGVVRHPNPCNPMMLPSRCSAVGRVLCRTATETATSTPKTSPSSLPPLGSGRRTPPVPCMLQ